MLIKIKRQKPRLPFAAIKSLQSRKTGKHILSRRRQEKQLRNLESM